MALLVTVLATLLALSGCGSDEPAEGSGGSGDTIELDFQGDDAPPVERVEMKPGQEIELVITSDEPGELHVHSAPEEQTIDYTAGTTTVTLSIDQPGVVDVERHDPEQLVLQLEVG
ncbi:hypothetical protein [Nocardioides coralli]|uniref:hypothetical protein n=1 Tax=Nocardioides coralli TaxID=2872154 RepID=UPI0020180198|nr:hypothetical protein [Nocardioides coralli]